LNGLAVISYYDVTNGDLKVAHCGNSTCSSGNTITTVDSAGDAGQSTSIAILNGLPIISYSSFTGVDLVLRVLRCGNVACSSGNTITPVDSGSVGRFSSIGILNGLAVISYSDFFDRALKVARCGNEFCNSGNTRTIVDRVEDIQNTSIAILNNLPIISY